MKRMINAAALLILVFIFVLQATAKAGECHWYCIRTKGNKQPPIPCEFSFIEEHDGYFIDRKHSDSNTDKVVYLTFDAGYENGNVARVLDTLKKENVPAAFFILSHLVNANADLVLRMVEEGHLVCNHTAHHPNLWDAPKERVQEEIKALEAAFKNLTGKDMSPYFRPPEGSFSRKMLQHVSALGYKTVFWSFAYADWDNDKQPGREKALKTIFDNMHNGAVILLHPTSRTNADILPEIIARLRADGYRFGTLEELCEP